MNRFLLCLLLTWISDAPVIACLNGATKALKDGTHLYSDAPMRTDRVPLGHTFISEEHLTDRHYYRDALKRLDKFYRATGDLDYQSDKGLLLILMKRYDEAIRLYLDLEQQAPDRYSTASNIGTAYELAGQDENALKWIQKAVALDPKSHDSSEWLHVKILEAKVKGPQYYTSSFLLGADLGTGPAPKSDLSGGGLERLSDALYYQLNERVSFVKPKDAIVAQLLFDLGNIEFLRGSRNALEDYELARKYGYAAPLINQRIQAFNKASASKPIPAPPSTNGPGYRPLVLGSVAALAVVWCVAGRRRRKA